MNCSCYCYQGSLRQFSCESLQLHQNVRPWSKEKVAWTNTFQKKIQLCSGSGEHNLNLLLSKSIRLPYDIPSVDDRKRNPAKNTVVPPCEDPSSLIRCETSRESYVSRWYCKWSEQWKSEHHSRGLFHNTRVRIEIEETWMWNCKCDAPKCGAWLELNVHEWPETKNAQRWDSTTAERRKGKSH